MIRLTDRKLRQAYFTIESILSTMKERGEDTNPLLNAIDYIIKRARLEGVQYATKEREIQESNKQKRRSPKKRRVSTGAGSSDSNE
jgi:hypothetical protein